MSAVRREAMTRLGSLLDQEHENLADDYSNLFARIRRLMPEGTRLGSFLKKGLNAFHFEPSDEESFFKYLNA